MFRAALQVVIGDFFHLRLGVKISNSVYSVCSSRPVFPTGPSVHFTIIIFFFFGGGAVNRLPSVEFPQVLLVNIIMHT